MRRYLSSFRVLCAAASLGAMLPCARSALADMNRLSTAERRAGWKLLFDGQTTRGWRGYNRPDVPPGWQAIDGALIRLSGGAGGKGSGGGDDLITEEQFDDFELELEWRLVEQGNSGVLYRVQEGASISWRVAPEMQVLDNTADPNRNRKQTAGALYDLYAPEKEVARAPGQWNRAKVLAAGTHVEHWLNGEKVVVYELGSEDFKERVAGSKFKNMPDFAKAVKGHICLQDHSNRVEYRNIKIRRLRTGVMASGRRRSGSIR